MVGGGRRHELAAAVDGMATHGGGVVLEAFLVGDHRWQRVHVVGLVALEYAVGEA